MRAKRGHGVIARESAAAQHNPNELPQRIYGDPNPERHSNQCLTSPKLFDALWRLSHSKQVRIMDLHTQELVQNVIDRFLEEVSQ